MQRSFEGEKSFGVPVNKQGNTKLIINTWDSIAFIYLVVLK